MNNCIDENKIFELTEGEIHLGEEKEMFSHIRICENCRHIYESYSKLKLNTSEFYKNIQVLENQSDDSFTYNENKTSDLWKFSKILTIAASIVLGYLLIVPPANDNKTISSNGNLWLSKLEKIDVESTISEWDLEVYTISNKIELILDQINQAKLLTEKGEK